MLGKRPKWAKSQHFESHREHKLRGLLRCKLDGIILTPGGDTAELHGVDKYLEKAKPKVQSNIFQSLFQLLLLGCLIGTQVLGVPNK